MDKSQKNNADKYALIVGFIYSILYFLSAISFYVTKSSHYKIYAVSFSVLFILTFTSILFLMAHNRKVAKILMVIAGFLGLPFGLLLIIFGAKLKKKNSEFLES